MPVSFLLFCFFPLMSSTSSPCCIIYGETEIPKKEIIIFNRKNANLSSWYSCKDKFNLSIVNSGLHASIEHDMGDCFGIHFKVQDITATPVIKVKAKYLPDKVSAAEADLLAGFTDSDDKKTYYPEKAVFVKSENGYTTFYFNYNTDLTIPERHFDPLKANGILFFTNILGVKNVNGSYLIEEISLVAEEPAKARDTPR
jgi:hypothetical protein